MTRKIWWEETPKKRDGGKINGAEIPKRKTRRRSGKGSIKGGRTAKKILQKN